MVPKTEKNALPADTRPGARPQTNPTDSLDGVIAGLERELPHLAWDLFALSGRVISLARLFEEITADGLADLGLNRAEENVLGILRSHTADTPSKLAKLVHQSPAGMTRTLDRLERMELIERKTDPDNLRQIRVVLTEKGLEIGERKLELQTQAISAAFGEMDRAAVDQADTLLRELLVRLGAAQGEKKRGQRIA
jgi:DNA-binding MarR family transcriptional regulator